MDDRVSRYPGRVKLVPVAGQHNVYDMTLADEPTVAGTKLNKANLLSDQVASSLGGVATPNLAFQKLKQLIDAAQSTANGRARTVFGNYSGTGSASKIITLVAEPLIMFIVGLDTSHNKSTGVTVLINGHPFCMGLTKSNWGLGPTYATVGGDGLKTDWAGNSVTVTGVDSYHCLNNTGYFYRYVAILK